MTKQRNKRIYLITALIHQYTLLDCCVQKSSKHTQQLQAVFDKHENSIHMCKFYHSQKYITTKYDQ